MANKRFIFAAPGPYLAPKTRAQLARTASRASAAQPFDLKKALSILAAAKESALDSGVLQNPDDFERDAEVAVELAYAHLQAETYPDAVEALKALLNCRSEGDPAVSTLLVLAWIFCGDLAAARTAAIKALSQPVSTTSDKTARSRCRSMTRAFLLALKALLDIDAGGKNAALEAADAALKLAPKEEWIVHVKEEAVRAQTTLLERLPFGRFSLSAPVPTDFSAWRTAMLRKEILCAHIRTNSANLERIRAAGLFKSIRPSSPPEAPWVETSLDFDGREVRAVFRMNTAAFSNLPAAWLCALGRVVLKDYLALAADEARLGSGAPMLREAAVRTDRVVELFYGDEPTPRLTLDLSRMTVDGETAGDDSPAPSAELHGDEALLHRIGQKTAHGQYQAVIDLIDALPTEQRTPRMLSERLRAVLNAAASESVRQRPNPAAFAALDSLSPLLASTLGEVDNALWLRRTADFYLLTDRAGEALELYDELAMADLSDGMEYAFYRVCALKDASRPFFRRFYESRLQAAWRLFEKIEPDIVRALRNGDLMGAALLGQRLTAVLGVSWATAFVAADGEVMTSPDLMGRGAVDPEKASGYVFVASPQGALEQIAPLLEFLNAAPDSVAKRWYFCAGRPALPAMSEATAGNFTLRTKELKCWLMKEHGDGVRIGVFAESLVGLANENGSDRGFGLLASVFCGLVGEAAFMRFVRGITILSKPPLDGEQGPCLTLEEFAAAFFNAVPQAKTFSLKQMRDEQIEFWLKPKDAAPLRLRADTTRGWHAAPILLNGYLGNDASHLNSLEAAGIGAGFFYFEISEDSGEQKAFLEALVECLDSRCAAHCRRCGEAFGTDCCYLDLYLWNALPVFAAVKSFLKKSAHRSVRAGWHSYRQDALRFEFSGGAKRAVKPRKRIAKPDAEDASFERSLAFGPMPQATA